MAKGEAGRTGATARGAVLSLLLALGNGVGLAGCDERLPGFADPPQYQPDASDGDAAADDDAG